MIMMAMTAIAPPDLFCDLLLVLLEEAFFCAEVFFPLDFFVVVPMGCSIADVN